MNYIYEKIFQYSPPRAPADSEPTYFEYKKLIANFVNVVPSKMIWVYVGFVIVSVTCLHISLRPEHEYTIFLTLVRF